MAKWLYFPEDWEPDDAILEWCYKQGLTKAMIEDQLERIKDHEFNPMRTCPKRTFRRWIRNSIQWGHIAPVVQKEYRTYQHQEMSAEERRRAEEDLRKKMERFKVVK